MHQANDRPFSPSDAWRTLLLQRKKWIAPAVIGLTLGMVYAYLWPRPWQASQTLLLRNEAVNPSEQPGRFRDADQLKFTLETVQGLAQSGDVLRQALAAVGPPDDRDAECWPTPRDVEGLVGAVKLTPPNGAEFGKTEIFHLEVQDVDVDRAAALAAAIAESLQHALAQLRNDRAAGMIAELARGVDLAAAEMSQAAERIKHLETSVGGGDLAELRMLMTSNTGDSDLRRRLNSIEDELRAAKLKAREFAQLTLALEQTRDEPRGIVSLPNSLLATLPSLQKLKEGLVEAQARAAELSGSRSRLHPAVAAAESTVEEMRGRLREEITSALRGVQIEQQVAAARIAGLTEERAGIHQRLNAIAGILAEYSALADEVKQRTAVLDQARRDLATAQAAQAAANSASLLTLVGSPQQGLQPVGPRRAVLAAMGLLGGLVCGLGWIFFCGPARPSRLPQSTQSAAVATDGETHALHATPANLPLERSAAEAPKASRLMNGVSLM